jgi:hypothetical protein
MLQSVALVSCRRVISVEDMAAYTASLLVSGMQGSLCMMSNSSAKPSQHERRSWKRLPLAIPVFLRGMDEHGRKLLEFGTALNVSSGGMLVAARRPVPLDASVAVEIPQAPLPLDVGTHGSVRVLGGTLVRSLPSSGMFYLAVRFNAALTVDP